MPTPRTAAEAALEGFLGFDLFDKIVSFLGTTLRIPKWIVGRWYESQYFGFNLSNFTTVAGTVYYVPITIPHGANISEVGINVPTLAASSFLHFGLYADANGQPGALLVNWGNVSAGTAGARSLTALNYTVKKGGLYWVAVMALGGTPQVSSHAAPTVIAPLVGASAIGEAQKVGWDQLAQASLPATAGSLTAAATVSRPRVQLKAA